MSSSSSSVELILRWDMMLSALLLNSCNNNLIYYNEIYVIIKMWNMNCSALSYKSKHNKYLNFNFYNGLWGWGYWVLKMAQDHTMQIQIKIRQPITKYIVQWIPVKFPLSFTQQLKYPIQRKKLCVKHKINKSIFDWKKIMTCPKDDW